MKPMDFGIAGEQWRVTTEGFRTICKAENADRTVLIGIMGPDSDYFVDFVLPTPCPDCKGPVRVIGATVEEVKAVSIMGAKITALLQQDRKILTTIAASPRVRLEGSFPTANFNTSGASQALSSLMLCDKYRVKR
jgi:hypothetical protein